MLWFYPKCLNPFHPFILYISQTHFVVVFPSILDLQTKSVVHLVTSRCTDWLYRIVVIVVVVVVVVVIVVAVVVAAAAAAVVAAAVVAKLVL
jgi:hypothetical protein